MAWAAAHVVDVAFVFDSAGEARQQLTIKWFVVELGEEMARVFIGDAIVALLNRVKDLIVHTGL